MHAVGMPSPVTHHTLPDGGLLRTMRGPHRARWALYHYSGFGPADAPFVGKPAHQK
jgi:hypothetical protein